MLDPSPRKLSAYVLFLRIDVILLFEITAAYTTFMILFLVVLKEFYARALLRFLIAKSIGWVATAGLQEALKVPRVCWTSMHNKQTNPTMFCN